MANPRGQQRDKPARDALRMEAALAEQGEPTPAKEGSIRWAARQLLIRAGSETAAFREMADRMDGKPAQAIIGGGEDDPALNVIARIENIIIDPKDGSS
jgi:hypothetical protein